MGLELRRSKLPDQNSPTKFLRFFPNALLQSDFGTAILISRVANSFSPMELIMSTSAAERVDGLTPRQKEIVRLVSLGCTTTEIAAILNLAESTVDNHKAAAMKVLGTDKSTVVTRLAIKSKLSPLDDRLTAAERRKSGRSGDGWN